VSSSKDYPPDSRLASKRSLTSWLAVVSATDADLECDSSETNLRLIGGVRHGRTLGSPVAVEILNSEWPKWEQEMSAAPGTPAQKQTKPRPGHADLAGMQKYNFDDARDVLERASARETAARVVAGALAKALSVTIGVAIVSHVMRIGEAAT
jgi:chorismate synthase